VKDSAESIEVLSSILNQGRCDLLRTKSLSALARERQTHIERDNFNATRVIDNLSGCPSFFYDRALDIALNGVVIPVSDTFVEQPLPDPLRDLGKRLGNHYLQCAIQSVSEGTGMLFRLEDLLELCSDEQLNFSNNAHCVFQSGKSRFIIDCSNTSNGAEALNGPHCKEWAKTTYGPLVLPTIEEICTDLAEFCIEFQRLIS
jgi:hypothetical protein